ncbi:MAG: ribonucleoside-diphosphate reductase subunit alpha [Verrucomicrobiales bacterium]|nr:ribonucleoside-diphosphate reductase subunit alpha [Verrucomicrobiales bacterium]
MATLDPLEGKKLQVRKRDGRIIEFDETRIYLALEAALKADAGLEQDEPAPESMQADAQLLTHEAVERCLVRLSKNESLEIERIQDVVEEKLMAGGFHGAAKRYIVYREERRKARAIRGDRTVEGAAQEQVFVTLPDGEKEVLDPSRLKRDIYGACRGVEDKCQANDLFNETMRNLYDGVHTEEIDKALVMSAKARIETEPAYTYVAARLLLNQIYEEVLPKFDSPVELPQLHRDHFSDYLRQGVDADRLSPDLLKYDLAKLADAFVLERDQQFAYMGIQTIYDRYLIHIGGTRIETPQYFYMRVSMGLAMNEANREERAIEFYHALSSFRFMSSTPTLFNAGTLHPQLSSCYLSTVDDDLESIFKLVADDARLSKWAGGLGNDWTNIRATGSHIKGTNGESQGVIPFLKVANDTAVAVNQGGKRKGAMCAYLETWHLDIEDFMDLRKNTGDERRRTPDMNTANWIPDLFMKRVKAGGEWTLFSPNDVADLHDLYGAAFEKRYAEYEAMAKDGEIKHTKTVQAEDLWRKMLMSLFETGHPWITFKDPSNVRSPQDHMGVVHSSNLCTEILLNTSAEETAVCNLGSVNLTAHIKDGELDEELIASTVRTAIRMLDNVIDINYYPTPEARTANMRHRPVGMGVMAFQDALYKLRIPYSSEAAVAFADRSMEMISYYAILTSSELAAERGTYESYEGSKWSRGLLPIDTIELLEQERGGSLTVDRSAQMDWTPVRESIAQHGVRNSNTMAIAPTATIANIIGVSQSIEPTYKNMYAKANLSGEFTVVNNYLVEQLKERNLWDAQMVEDLKYYDGSVLKIDRIPDDMKDIFRTSFEIDSKWLIACAARRQKWIDMGQSLNLYFDLRQVPEGGKTGRILSDMYFFAWEAGLKTTYYLRTLGATNIEKSTVDINSYGVQPEWMKNKSASSDVVTAPTCSILDPECEACQ